MRTQPRRQHWRPLQWLASFLPLTLADDAGFLHRLLQSNDDADVVVDMCVGVPCPDGSTCFVVKNEQDANGTAPVCFAQSNYYLGDDCEETRCPKSEAEGMICRMWPPFAAGPSRRPACKYCHLTREDQTQYSCITKNKCEFDYPQVNIPPCTVGGYSRADVDLKESDDEGGLNIGLLVAITIAAMCGCSLLVGCFVWSMRSNPLDDDGPELPGADRDAEDPYGVKKDHWGVGKEQSVDTTPSGRRITQHRNPDEGCHSDFIGDDHHEHHHQDHASAPHEGPLHLRMSHHVSNQAPTSHSSRREVEKLEKRGAIAPSVSEQKALQDFQANNARMIREVTDQGTLATMALEAHSSVPVPGSKHNHGMDATCSSAAAEALGAAQSAPARSPRRNSKGSPRKPSKDQNQHHHHHHKTGSPRSPSKEAKLAKGAAATAATSRPVPLQVTASAPAPPTAPAPLAANASGSSPGQHHHHHNKKVSPKGSPKGSPKKGPSPREAHDEAVVAVADAAATAALAAAASAKAVAAVAVAQAAREQNGEQHHHHHHRKE